MGYAGAKVEEELFDVFFDIFRWKRAKELEELGADAVAAIEDEGEEFWEDNGDGLLQWGVYRPRSDSSREIAEGVTALAVRSRG